MNPHVMIALVGEQPIPNLLPIRALKPQRVALMHTDRTRAVAQRLARLIDAPADYLCVKPYDVRDCQRALKKYLAQNTGSMTFNLTGGTKTMLLAAYTVAVSARSAVIYLQTEGSVSRLYAYQVGSSGLIENEVRELPTLITADDYLKAHLPDYAVTGYSQAGGKLTIGGEFEQTLADALTGNVDEVLAGVHPAGVASNIDIDLVIRCGNQVGIAEAKSNRTRKEGLDQLAMAGGREYLGTYTAKFLIVGNVVGSSLKQLADARGIHVIELPSYAASGGLSQADQDKLINTVRSKLGVRGS